MSESIHPGVRIGHAHLRVADLQRATYFYREVLGFDVVVYGPEYDVEAAFLSAGGHHHHIGLNTWESAGGTPPPPGHTDLYHVAILYSDRRELARAVKCLLDHGYPIDGASDHGVSEAVYLTDPDGKGLELYRDRPRKTWTDEEGKPIFKMPKKLDLDDLLKELRAD